MARRRHTRKSSVLEYRRLSVDELRQRIEHCRENGNIRAAIEMARECHRREPAGVHTDLLGGLYVERARQLIEKHLYTEALTVLSNSVALGHGSVELLRMMFECGLQGRQYASALSAFKALADTPERSWASTRLADEAVATGDELGHLCEPSVRQDALRIRRAFEAFERSDDAGVSAELKAIGLKSPCTGWKWFLLGLAAYCRGEHERAGAAWGRLEEEGRAGRLARLLGRVLLGAPGQPEVSSRLNSKVTRLLGNPGVAMLKEIRNALNAEDPDTALELCGKLLSGIPVVDRGPYALRLGRALGSSICVDHYRTEEFRRIFGLFPEDPGLLRTAALATEEEDPYEAIDLWSCFMEGIDKIPAIPPGLQKRARAMVFRRMGDLAEGAGVDIPDFSWMSRAESPAVYYRKSIKCYPDDLETHEKLLDVLVRRKAGRPAERHALEILQSWPAHARSLLFVGQRCLKRNAFRKALKYFESAREAEPFNDEIRHQMQLCHLMSARRRVEEGKFELARQDYRQTMALGGTDEWKAFFYCRWAALEWRGGEAQHAEELFATALRGVDDPFAIYLAMVIEIERAAAPSHVQRRFMQLIDERLVRQPTAAGVMAVTSLVRLLEATDRDLEVLGAHHQALTEYLRLAFKGVELPEAQLLELSRWLESCQLWEALEPAALQGAERFGDNCFFALRLARAQRGRGLRLSRATCRLVRRAGCKALESGNIKMAEDLAVIIALHQRETRAGLPLVGGLLAYLDSMLDEQESEDPDWDDTAPRPPRRRRKQHANQPLLFAEMAEEEAREV